MMTNSDISQWLIFQWGILISCTVILWGIHGLVFKKSVLFYGYKMMSWLQIFIGVIGILTLIVKIVAL